MHIPNANSAANALAIRLLPTRHLAASLPHGLVNMGMRHMGGNQIADVNLAQISRCWGGLRRLRL
jgi:hypothetical protein